MLNRFDRSMRYNEDMQKTRNINLSSFGSPAESAFVARNLLACVKITLGENTPLPDLYSSVNLEMFPGEFKHYTVTHIEGRTLWLSDDYVYTDEDRFERAKADIERAARNNIALRDAALRPLPQLSDDQCRKLHLQSIYRYEDLRMFYPRKH